MIDLTEIHTINPFYKNTYFMGCQNQINLRFCYAYIRIYHVSLFLRKMTNHLWNQYRFLKLLK